MSYNQVSTQVDEPTSPPASCNSQSRGTSEVRWAFNGGPWRPRAASSISMIPEWNSASKQKWHRSTTEGMAECDWSRHYRRSCCTCNSAKAWCCELSNSKMYSKNTYCNNLHPSNIFNIFKIFKKSKRSSTYLYPLNIFEIFSCFSLWRQLIKQSATRPGIRISKLVRLGSCQDLDSKHRKHWWPQTSSNLSSQSYICLILILERR